MTFVHLDTARLVLRPMRLGDAASLHARRNDPAVARWQDWAVPYPQERADEIVAPVANMDGPANDQWWMLAIADRATDEVYGDLAIRMTWGMRAAEIGYTLASAYWGEGYATEAVKALLPYLFDEIGVTRVSGMLHPENRASAQVLERTGFVFEGHTRLSYWVGDDNSDDWIYGLVRDDWEAWCDRPRHAAARVTLRPVDLSNEAAVFRLRTHKTQEAFVAPMAASFADALFPEIVNGGPVVPWLRAIHADEALVGFVMLALRTDHHPEPFLWRLLIDRLHQRRSIGRMTLNAVVRQLTANGDSTLMTSWTQGRGSPEPFYLGYGFIPTGEMLDEEIEARFTFQ